MPDNRLAFKISAGLKNIIGRDLITDDYVAIFELVKNSFDAYATKVKISFEEDKIIISDDGKGMDIDDINNKWLFVAYSAKKEGVEDLELEKKEFENYRDKIQTKKFFAGAKGIGRFSCDRLGSKLKLTTKKASPNSEIEQIEVNWNDFDEDAEKKFIEIKVRHRTLDSNSRYFKQLQHGTILEISQLNSTWDRKKKQQLKFSLEKLINPFEQDHLNKFSIIIEDESENQEDYQEDNEREKVNGEVKNFVFETLGLKSTQILTEIDPEGEYITTSIQDRGILIYKIRRRNNTNPQLKNIKYHLFYLNRSAKTNFAKIMGIPSVRFGSIFLYKNGIRIAPYGDAGVDYFGLDTRKTQGVFRKLGTRELIGRIEINGENPQFKETSSRDGGLVRNDHYQALLRCFITQCLEKLEHYVTEVQWTSKQDKDSEDLSQLENIKAKSALLKLVSEEVEDGETDLLDIDQENLNLMTTKILEEATKKDIEALRQIANKLGNSTFNKQASNIELEHIKVLELQNQLKVEEEKRQKKEAELEAERQKSTYLLATRRTLSEDAEGLIHTIKLNSTEIRDGLDAMIEKLLSKNYGEQELLTKLGSLKINAERSLMLAEIATRSDFKKDIDARDVDIVKYFVQYLDNVYKQTYQGDEIIIEYVLNNAKLLRRVSVLDLSIIIDNIISNSTKWAAEAIRFVFKNFEPNKLSITISDSGVGLSTRFMNIPEKIFDLGVGDTPPKGVGGSGIGLYYTRKLLSGMNAIILFKGNNIELPGACFEVIFN